MFVDNKLGVIVCSHVFNEEREILYVTHKQSGWQFMCGEYDHKGTDGNLVGVGHLTSRDPTINNISDLKTNWEAERKTTLDEWYRIKIED